MTLIPRVTCAPLRRWTGAAVVGLFSVSCAAGHVRSTAPEANPSDRFGFESVRERARRLAAQPYADADPAMPSSLKGLDYDAYRLIRYRPDKAVWADEALPFRLEFFHPGYLFLRRVDVNLLGDGAIVPVRFSTDLFRYDGEIQARQVPEGLGFAGVRVRYPLSLSNRYDEVISFLGASYFRALGRGQVYGASARGLAIDAGLGNGEEFPCFSAFWFERPTRRSASISFFGLLQSPSVTGAYRFNLRPGETTVVEIEACLFARRSIQRLGIAPLSSMFLFDENTARGLNEFRPEVHDSDGLLLANGDGEWIWRPLRNPGAASDSRFALTRPRGFGLMQRERRFECYRDREANYHQRPSIWVEPDGDWGVGAVELIELSSDREGYDNVTAFWVPAERLLAGGERTVSYHLYFASSDPAAHSGGKAIATRRTRRADGSLDVRVEFGGKTLARLDPGSPPEAVVTATRGAIRETAVSADGNTGSWWVTFNVTPEGNEPVELRACLRRGRDALSETWSYVWQRPN